ncbi:MAG: sulfatase, partial [Planctomycetales bacterium]|nr:sulfatase [Planctomycetales bacterium]
MTSTLRSLGSALALVVALAAIAANLLACPSARAETTASDAKRPNILFAFADDWGRYASIYAERRLDGPGTVNDVVRTPHVDRVAREGVVFRNAFVNAPSCTPCRSTLLSGQYFFRTNRAAILQGAIWDSSIPSYPLLLRDAGYHIGKLYKVWSPGTPADAPYGQQQYGYEAPGPNFNAFSQVATKLVDEGSSVAAAKQSLLDKVGGEFDAFLKAKPADAPFCFWFGPTNVHRKWIRGSGKRLWNLDPEQLQGKLPPFLPDVPLVREDFADYLGEAMAFDAALGVLLQRLEAAGELDNTLVVVSGDHGAPGFPRGKCNLYDFGVAVTLTAMWPGKIPAGRVVDDFASVMDLAPTFLEAAGQPVPEVMTGRSLLPVLTSKQSGLVDDSRGWVITGRERHVAAAREGNLPYPQRALRTKDYLYMVNFKPDRWPMGDPGPVAKGEIPDYETLANNTFACFGDLDASPTKAWMVAHRDDAAHRQQYEWGFARRPERELYLLASDPHQIKNVADQPEHRD